MATEMFIAKQVAKSVLGISKKKPLMIEREPGKDHMREAYAAQAILTEAGIESKLSITDTGVIVMLT